MQTVKEKVEDFDDKLKKYMAQKGLPISLPKNIDEYLNMPRSRLAQLSTADLGEIQYELLSQAYYLQDLNNEQSAKLGKFKDELQKTIEPLLNNYSHIFKTEDQRAAATYDNRAAAKWAEYISNIQAAVTRTTHLSKKLESLARCIDNIARRRHDA